MMTTMKLTTVAACASWIAGVSIASPLETPRVSFTPRSITHRGGGAYAAEVGRLSVPENRAAKSSRSIRLAVLRLKTTAEKPGPPTIVLPGGPGNSATAYASSPAWEPYLELGDVVLMDPRGTGQSEPDLSWSSDAIRPARFFGDRATAYEHVLELARSAAEQFRAEGVDLAGYHAGEMAADLDDLRRALGYDQVHLLAHSFGTHVGLELVRAHPETVARFVSVGTAGPDDVIKLPSELDQSLRRLSALIAGDPAIGDAMPDLFGAVVRVLKDLSEDPLPVPIHDPDTGDVQDVALGPFGLQFLLVADFGDTSDLPVWPRLIRSLEHRDASVVQWFLQKRVQQFSRLPVLMLAARAASGASDDRWRRIEREAKQSPFGLARCMFAPEIDDALGAGDVGDASRGPIASDVPTLFVSGTLDANTPPEQAERVRAGFSSSGHVTVEFGGHEDLMPDPQVQKLILRFLAGAAPEDVTLERPALRFAPLEGDAAGFDHPALR